MRSVATCINCGKDFTPDRRSKGKFCNHECWYTWLRAQPNAACASCRKPFRSRKVSKHRFCSRACVVAGTTLDRSGPEPAPVDGARWLALGRGRFALVDAAEFQRLSAHLWTHIGRTGVVATIGGRRTLLHHAVLGLPHSVIIDHKNGDPLDNRSANLRVATAAENVRNSTKKRRPNPTSQFKGVWRSAKGRNWQAMIRAGETRRWLGGFATEQEAAEAYDAAARELHGAFACVNFPRDGERGAFSLAPPAGPPAAAQGAP